MAANGDCKSIVDAATELKEFDAVFSEILETLSEEGIQNPETADAYAWFKRVGFYVVLTTFSQ